MSVFIPEHMCNIACEEFCRRENKTRKDNFLQPDSLECATEMLFAGMLCITHPAFVNLYKDGQELNQEINRARSKVKGKPYGGEGFNFKVEAENDRYKIKMADANKDGKYPGPYIGLPTHPPAGKQPLVQFFSMHSSVNPLGMTEPSDGSQLRKPSAVKPGGDYWLDHPDGTIDNYGVLRRGNLFFMAYPVCRTMPAKGYVHVPLWKVAYDAQGEIVQRQRVLWHPYDYFRMWNLAADVDELTYLIEQDCKPFEATIRGANGGFRVPSLASLLRAYPGTKMAVVDEPGTTFRWVVHGHNMASGYEWMPTLYNNLAQVLSRDKPEINGSFKDLLAYHQIPDKEPTGNQMAHPDMDYQFAQRPCKVLSTLTPISESCTVAYWEWASDILEELYRVRHEEYPFMGTIHDQDDDAADDTAALEDFVRQLALPGSSLKTGKCIPRSQVALWRDVYLAFHAGLFVHAGTGVPFGSTEVNNRHHVYFVQPGVDIPYNSAVHVFRLLREAVMQSAQ